MKLLNRVMKIRQMIDIIEGSTKLTEKSAHGSAWVLISCDETNEVLLAKRARGSNNPGQWNLFGGGIERNETASQTAHRELGEEAGLVIDPTLMRFKGSIHGMNFFVVKISRNDIQMQPNPKEIAKVKWFALDALPGNLHKSTIMFIKACTRRLVVGENVDAESVEFEKEMAASLRR